jgi:hypothetical protein
MGASLRQSWLKVSRATWRGTHTWVLMIVAHVLYSLRVTAVVSRYGKLRFTRGTNRKDQLKLQEIQRMRLYKFENAVDRLRSAIMHIGNILS